jgi:pimeloyl-ACP methyl ester carboxylesterase
MDPLSVSDTNALSPYDSLLPVYDFEKTAIFALKSDPRFYYCMYVPRGLGKDEKIELFVAVHGSSRTSFLEFRDGFADFGRWNRCAILCPVFPIGVLGDGERHGYKYLQEGDIRYDHVLLSMIDEISAKYGQDWTQFALFGYSGGGHFAHRFSILHPEKLWAVSIGAPGSVTLLDTKRNWWVGIADLEERFGVKFDAAALAKLPVQMLVGEVDLQTWEITHKPGTKYWMEGANDAGSTRPERLQALQQSFESVGVNVRLDLVPGVSHDRLKFINRVQDFLAAILKTRRQQD